jgi:hypothetical protein
MLGSLGSFLQVALTVLTLASLAGLGLMRGTVTNLRETLRDAREEVADKDRRYTADLADKDRRLTEAEAEIIRLRAKINSQAKDIDAYGRLVRGETYWSELGEKLDSHHGEAKIHWSEDERLLKQIIADLDKFTDGDPA